MDHLIANSGLQFIKREIEFNPDQAMIMPNGKPLKYSFIDTKDFIDNTTVFNLLYYHNDSNVFIPTKELDNSDIVVRRSNGREVIDESGLPQVDPMANISLFSSYQPNHPDIYNMNTLTSFRVNNPNGNTHEKISAFELLLDKWLPMPMFKKEIDGITTNTPLAWCRVKISKIGHGERKGTERYRLIWAFDTQLASDEFSVLRPVIYPEDEGVCEYCLCNKTDLLFSFLSSNNDFHAFSDYIAAILGINTNDENNSSPFKFKAFYIYFVNFIRLSNGAPEISLHDNPKHDINVDLVLDIGNSRTCGVLFEEGDFRRGKMLELTDLSMPWINYENKTYDMRVVFRKADFGNDIVLDEQMFQWHSFVRIGEEARRLIYRSMEECGIAEKTTNYSSPKRYLWDLKEYESQWENLITTDDSYNLSLNPEISIPQLSNLFNADGSIKNEEELNNNDDDFLDFSKKEHHYSRSSLMTFAFIELFQHALCQINSVRYRDKWGNIDLKRVLRNVIITCPTSMPMKEQIFLRQSAQDAFNALTICHTGLEIANIIPSPKALKNTDPYAPIQDKVWKYDEASCCQLVYL
ncbi:MAG: virulence factor SrfB, partial [Bacteroidaceae bacterium]